MAARRRTPDRRGRVRSRGRDDRGRPALSRRQLAALPARLLAPAAHRDGTAAAGFQSAGAGRRLKPDIAWRFLWERLWPRAFDLAGIFPESSRPKPLP